MTRNCMPPVVGILVSGIPTGNGNVLSLDIHLDVENGRLACRSLVQRCLTLKQNEERYQVFDIGIYERKDCGMGCRLGF
jgi:hypothetical protein